MNSFTWLRSKCPISSDPLGWIFLQLGLFFLASSALLSGLFVLAALICCTRYKRRPYLSDPWNYPFLLAGIWMLVGSLSAFSGWLALVGLANWLPFFWFFWAAQPYLATPDSRKRCALCLLLGTVPVVITGFGQLWLGWEGPWQALNGLIVWFVATGGEPNGRLSGLFDYANIAGAWLALVWPFSLAALFQPALNFWKRNIVLVFAIAIVAALVLTDSRNAWGGFLLAIPFVLGPLSWPWLLPLLFLMLLPVALAVVPGVGLELQELARQIVPEGLWSRLNDMRYSQQRSLVSTRLSQWKIAIAFLSERPWFGWGAAAFSILYPLRTGQWHGHAHNLPLEIGVAHGLPVTFLIVSAVLALLITALARGVLAQKSSQKNGISNSIFDRAWWSASLIIVFLHGADMPFFDSRLNIAGWLLLSGLRCLIIPFDSVKLGSSKPVFDAELTGLV